MGQYRTENAFRFVRTYDAVVPNARTSAVTLSAYGGTLT